MTPIIRFAIFFAFVSELFCMIYRFRMLKEFNPTVIPEQKPPPRARTTLLEYVHVASRQLSQNCGLSGVR